MQLDFFKRLWSPPRAPVPAPSLAPAAMRPTKVSSLPLQERARGLLTGLGYAALAERLTVRWNSRLQSTAGMAYPTRARVTLNPHLLPFGQEEIDRTLLHEVAHLLAHERAGRRRIAPHGPEWRLACQDLGLREETRCHSLPLPRRQIARTLRYRCPACAHVIHRVQPLRRKSACVACCRQHNHGRFDERFCFVKVKTKAPPAPYVSPPSARPCPAATRRSRRGTVQSMAAGCPLPGPETSPAPE